MLLPPTLGEATEILGLAERSAGIGVWDVDLATEMARGTAQFFRIMGLEPTDQLVPMDRIRALRHPDDRERVVEGFRRALEDGVDAYEIEYRILRPDGQLRWIFGRGRVVRDAEGRPCRYSGVDIDITARKEAEAERTRLAAIVDASGDAIWSWGLDGAILSWNREAERLLGYAAQEMLGRSILTLVPPERQGDAEQIMRRVAAGESLVQVETTRARKDGSRVEVALTVSPIRDGGAVVAAATIARDITSRKQAELRQQLLVAELDHRVKNTLATVQSIALRTLGKGAASQALIGRIAALAKAHTALSQTAWRGVGLHALLESVLAAHQPSSERLSMVGPPVLLEAKSAQALALATNELGTNAAKYGALSVREGRVEIRWSVTGGARQRLLFTWKELDGPPIDDPKRRGFGTELIERSLAYELGADVQIRFEPDGLFCRIDAPLGARSPEHEGASSRPVRGDRAPSSSPGQLWGWRVLVAEDAHLIAADVERALRDEGAIVIGPAPSLSRATELFNAEPVDAAVLDVNLDGEMIFPLAESLIARAVPVVFLTGYDRGRALPEMLRSVPLVSKPAQADAVVAALKQACARRVPEQRRWGEQT